MRNLKRVLALAMALVMILGMMVIGSSAASYSDSAAIDEDYVEAVEILTGMGVFRGTGKGFGPKEILDRASAATLIYRVITGDVTDSKVELYDYASFTDTVEGAWYNGYVTYAANGKYIVGDGTGKFNPTAPVTGVQVLKIMLRAMGYGQNGEFEGAAWSDNVLTVAHDLGLLENVKGNDLNLPAARELVAQLLFDAIQAPTTHYTPAFGYTDVLGGGTSISEKVFGLTSAEIADDWGRPAVAWYNAKKGLAKGIYVVFPEAPIATYTTAVSHCDIAKDQGAKKDYKTDFYFNGKYVADKFIDVTDTKPTVGAQGTQVEVYADRVVVVDTYLAQVTWLNYEKADKNGHIYQEASMKINVFLGSDCDDLAAVYTVPGNDYARYTYVLVNINEAGEYAEIVGEPETFEGAQSKIWKNESRHTIDKVDYTDAVHFHKDAAKNSPAKFTWFLDQFGNLIGSAEIAAKYGYAVLKDMNWVKGEGAEATLVYMDGTEETVTVATIDGAWVDGWAFDNKTTILDDQAKDEDWGEVSTEPRYNDEYLGCALYKVTYNKDGSVSLHGIVGRNEVVSYSDYATIDTSSSVILDGDGFGKLYVTTDTEILVREGNARAGYTYETYTIDTLPEIADEAAEIFYTIKWVYGSTYAVDRLYIKDAILEADFGTHLFTTTDEYYRVAGTSDYYMTVLVDGVEREIVTDYETVSKLAANTGKLFHIEWFDYTYFDYDYADYYGYVYDVRLVNEFEDKDYNPELENFYGCCNYLSDDITLTASSLICGGASYRFDANTVVYGAIDSVDELTGSVVNYDGIWVLADPTTSYSRAAVIYVGTKLSESTKITVVEDDANIESVKVEGTKITVTLAVDETECDFIVVGANGNTVVNGELGYAECNEETTYVEVVNEAATDDEEYEVVIVTSKSKATSEITITNVVMDAEAGCTVTFKATRSDGKTIKAERFTVELYNANGNKVYTENTVAATDGTNEYEATLAYELTQGAEYYVVVTAAGLSNCEGDVAQSDLYEATVEV